MPRVNLLYIITKLELGGAQKQLLSLIQSIDTKKFNVFLYTAKEGLLVEEARGLGSVTLKQSRYLERRIHPLKDILAVVEIYRYIKSQNIHVVHTHSSKAGILGRLAARLSKVPTVIHTVHGWPFHSWQSGFLRWLYIVLERVAAGWTNTIIVVSEYDKAKGLTNKIGQPHQYRLISYAINYENFRNQDSLPGVRESFGIAEDALVVSMVGCFKPQKSPLSFIKLAALVSSTKSNAKFILVGDGVLRKKVEALISGLGLKDKVILAGWRRDIPEILQATDVFVLTSLWEGLPISVLEAMAAAKPVIVTDTGGIREVISSGENGFLADPGDVNGIAHRLSELLERPQLREDLGRKARVSIDGRYALPGMVKSYQDLYV